MRWLLPTFTVFWALAACHPPDLDVALAGTGGNPDRGKQIIRSTGCGSCHDIPGIREADGRVAPPLTFFAERTFIAGRLPNTPRNLIRWIRDPQSVEPGTAMPTLGLDEAQARDVAAYLYTLH